MISLLNRNRYLFLIDVILIILGAPLSFLIRLDVSPLFIRHVPVLILFAIVGLIIKPFLYWAFGLYRHFWRYASTHELLLIVTAITVSSLVLTVLFLAIILPYGLIYSFPRSVLIIDWLLQLIFVGGIRFLVRVSAEGSGVGENFGQNTRQKRVLIAGAGDAGAMIAREMQYNPGLGIIPIAFTDDDPNKVGKRIHNIPVLGKLRDIPHLVQKWYINEVVIAMPAAPGKVIREIAQACEIANVPSKTIPGIYELLDGTVSINQLRNVEIEDLLRREPIRTDIAAVSELIRDKRVLVTGGGGSIGSELCRQVLRCKPAELTIMGHGENSVFEIYQELYKQLTRDNQTLMLDIPKSGGKTVNKAELACSLRAVIADIRFPDHLRSILKEYRPEIVFHAAAHKHVPLMELNPAEAITNNVLGTRNLLDAALAVGVERFVMISTDKAVNPTSIMGTSKRVAELLVLQAAKVSGKPYVAVRFGNVLGSRGSVVLTFKQQIASGGPVTVTHPEMRRYFMSIPEAVQLVLQAAELGQGGEVFVLDMGEPVKIVDLARDLIELSGLTVGRDIDIVFTGIRPGEKLFEELFVPGEVYKQTRHEKIFIAGNASSFVPPCLEEAIKTLEMAVRQNDKTAILHNLQNLIPEFRPTPRIKQEKVSALYPF